MAKSIRTFRLDVELYGRFRDLASRSGYTVTGALEKFMGACVEKGVLSFPGPVGAGGDVEAEARVMLAWIKKGQHWYSFESGEKEFSVEGRLLQLLPQVRDRTLREQMEESLKTA